MTSLGGVEPCACSAAWPALVVHTDDGRRIDVVPAATPGGLACLYEARCAHCGLTYPGPFRVPPRATACRDVRAVQTRSPRWSSHQHRPTVRRDS